MVVGAGALTVVVVGANEVTVVGVAVRVAVTVILIVLGSEEVTDVLVLAVVALRLSRCALSADIFVPTTDPLTTAPMMIMVVIRIINLKIPFPRR